jgi:hypothetical protein
MERRAAVIERLAHAFDFPLPENHGTNARKEKAGPFPVTIGAEIEIHWRTLIPEHERWFTEPYSSFSNEKKRSFDELCDGIDRELKHRYQTTVDAGIPNGRKCQTDGYHEFAHRPVNWYGTLGDEIGLLFDAGLIPRGFEHPLHLTLGGLTNSREMTLLAVAIELSGGSSAERMRAPSHTRPSWSRKSWYGISERPASELERGYTTGIELRALLASDNEQVRQTMRTAHVLGTGLFDRQQGLKTPVADTWQGVREETLRLLKSRGLASDWDNPMKEGRYWAEYGKLFHAPETERFIGNVREAVDTIERHILEANREGNGSLYKPVPGKNEPDPLRLP